MRSAEVSTGRRIAVVLHSGDDVLESIAAVCAEHGIRQGYIPLFLGAFRSVRFIASQVPGIDPEPPLKDSVSVTYAEGVGSGSISWDAATGAPHVHLHVAIGVKDTGATGFAGHVLEATTHYVAELVIDEVLSPEMVREPDELAHGLPNLTFA